MALFLVQQALASPPYPEYDYMPRPPEPGWNPGVLPQPRYEYERASEDCHLPQGLYRYQLMRGQDYRSTFSIRKAVLKLHVNEGGLAILTVEIQPERSVITLSRLLGDEPKQELYVLNSYRAISDLRRCSGAQLSLSSDGVRLYDKVLRGSVTGQYEPATGCIRVSGQLYRTRSSTGLSTLYNSEVSINLDRVCFAYKG